MSPAGETPPVSALHCIVIDVFEERLPTLRRPAGAASRSVKPTIISSLAGPCPLAFTAYQRMV